MPSLLQRLWPLVLLLDVTARSAFATGLAIAPIRLEIGHGERAAVLDLTNTESDATDVQVRVQRWLQSDDHDVYLQTDDFTISPPRFSLEGGAHQTVRLYRHAGEEVRGELSYRVFVDQIPTTPGEPGTVRLPIHMLLPLFVAGSDKGNAIVEWRAKRRGEQIELALHNRGTRTIRITSLSVSSAQTDTKPDSLLLYLLPGADRTVRLATPPGLDAGSATVIVRGDSDAGALHENVALEPGD